MNTVEKAYVSGMVSVLSNTGMNKTAAMNTARTVVELNKKASMFNFSDNQDGGGSGFGLGKLILPLVAAAITGYVGYNSGINGDKDKSAFTNVKNYIGGLGDKIIRRSRPRPFYDINRYING